MSSKFPKYFLAALLLTAFLNLLLPYPAIFPAAGLDPSWGYAMNQVIAQNLAIGKEIIFTYGPYSAIFHHQFHPATYNLIVLGSLYFSLCYTLSLMLLAQNIKLRWGFFFFLMIAVLDLREVLLISYPLVASLVVFRLCFPHPTAGVLKFSPKLVTPHLLQGSLFLIFSLLGFLPLVKGSLIISCAASLILSCAALLHVKKKSLAALITIAPILSAMVFWSIAHQEISNLPAYFITMRELIVSYNETMALEVGNSKNLPTVLFGSAVILYVIFREKSFTLFPRFLLSAMIGLFLFISFKGGFVRHDNGHASSYCNAQTLIIALLLPFILQYKIPRFLQKLNLAPLPLIGVILYSILNSDGLPSFSTALVKIINQPLIYQHLAHHDSLQKDFDARISEIKKAASLPILAGTSDIYSFDQSYLIASENKWSPRPIFQSYQAATKTMAQINADHLLGASAPDNIFFAVQTIDGRFPTHDDGLSWPILLQNYAPVKMVNGFLLLKKKSSDAVAMKNISSNEYKFGEEVEIKNGEEILFTEFEIKPSLLGKLVTIFYKPSQLQIDVTLNDGSTRNFRIISSMVESGFVISPLIENAEEFKLLYGKEKSLRNKIVKSFKISQRGDYGFLWQSSYKVRFSRIR